MSDGTVHTSFRKKLLVHVGVTVGLVFVLTFLLLWMGSTIWFRVDAERFLRNEAESIAGYIVRAGGTLNAEAYTWNEPHHLFSESRIDPVFVQVFDSQRKEIFSTANIADFTPGAWPGYLVQTEGDAFSPASDLETRFIGQAELYFLTYPMRSVDGNLVGYIQAARYVPNIEGRVVRVLWIAGLTLLALLVGLLVSLHVRAGKLLEPLHAIARTADRVSARELDVRLPADPEMDLESHVLSQSFNRLLDRLDASFSDMRRFTSNASHQLQTPLTVMKGHVDVTLRKERDARAYRETLEILQGEIREMIRMVRALLTLSRLEHAAKGEAFEKVELSSVLDPIRIRHAADAQRLDVQAADDVCIQGNREWMQMILENLVDNALKYAPEGAVSVEIKEASDQVEIVVADTGPGLPNEDQEHLAERFFRGSNARDQGVKGHGLGLALVDRLVAMQHGSWQLEGDASGTRVTLRFPAC